MTIMGWMGHKTSIQSIKSFFFSPANLYSMCYHSLMLNKLGKNSKVNTFRILKYFFLIFWRIKKNNLIICWICPEMVKVKLLTSEDNVLYNCKCHHNFRKTLIESVGTVSHLLNSSQKHNSLKLNKTIWEQCPNKVKKTGCGRENIITLYQGNPLCKFSRQLTDNIFLTFFP